MLVKTWSATAFRKCPYLPWTMTMTVVAVSVSSTSDNVSDSPSSSNSTSSRPPMWWLCGLATVWQLINLPSQIPDRQSCCEENPPERLSDVHMSHGIILHAETPSGPIRPGESCGFSVICNFFTNSKRLVQNGGSGSSEVSWAFPPFFRLCGAFLLLFRSGAAFPPPLFGWCGFLPSSLWVVVFPLLSPCGWWGFPSIFCARFWIRKTVTSKASWIGAVYSRRDQPWAWASERRRSREQWNWGESAECTVQVVRDDAEQ